MRIFTLGKNGIPLFFFALLLFSGTYSSYGQACPTIEFDTQIFCDQTEAEVGDLSAPADVVWYSDAAMENRLDETLLLVNNGVYYAGNEAGNCDNPTPVTVIVNSMPEVLGVQASPDFEPVAMKQSLGSIGLCVADVENPGVFIGDLRTNTTNAVSPETDGVDRWYFGEDEATAVPLSDEDELQEGTYWVERVVQTHSGECITYKRRTAVALFSEDAPEGPENQTFCAANNPTLADIEASGNNRYYSSADSDARLSENTPLVDGTTYFVSTFGSTCESFARLAVTVTVTPLTITESTQSFCESQSVGNDVGTATVADLSPEGGVWYADDTFSTPLAPEEQLVDGEDYFLEIENCETTRVVTNVDEAPNAGSTSQLFYCENAGEIDILGDITHSVLGAPDDNGTINHPAFDGTSFDPADLGVGTYNFTHTVQAPENSLCDTDTAAITITITEAPEAGDPINETICVSELENPQALLAEFSSYLTGRDQGGSFDLVSTSDVVETLSVFELFQEFSDEIESNPIGTFSVIYNVSNENECSDSAAINVTVQPDSFAGDDATIQLSEESENTVSLEEALAQANPDVAPQPNGTWTDEEGTSVEGSLVPTTPGTFTYTVSPEGACSDSATVTVLAIPMDCPIVSDTTQEFCESEGTGNEGGPATVEDLQPEDATWYATATSEEPLAPTTELVDGASYFAGNTNGDCTERPEVVVSLVDSPSAGSTTQITVCSNDEPFDLVSRLKPSGIGPADPGGTFDPQLASGTTIFDPAVDVARTYKYTVQSTTDCPDDSAVITVNITEAPDAGSSFSKEFCLNSEDELPTVEEFLANYTVDNRDENGFNPSLEELEADFLENPFSTFTTVYSVTANGCTATASLSITINERVPADAGDDVPVNVCSTAGVQNLFDFLTEDAIPGGVFSAPYEDGTFDPSTAGTEPVEITYTINEDIACVTGEASATITITVIEGPDAGENGEITLNIADEPVNLFESLEGTPEEGGTWTPGNANGDLDPSTLSAGTYTYVYTVSSENGCEASATVTVTIEGEVTCPVITDNEQSFCESILSGNDSRLPTVSDLLPAGATWYASADATEALPTNTVLVSGTTYFAGNSNGTCEERQSVTVTLDDSPNAGSTSSVTLCENGDPIDLMDEIRPSILGDADLGGTFSPALASGTSIFDPSVDAAGTYTYTVESTNDVCPTDEAVISITVIPNANAGEDGFEVEFCATQEPEDLTESLPEGVDTNGTFEGLEGNIFDPAAFEVGSHEFTYTVTVEGDCPSEDTSVVTVIVTEAPAAPVAEAQSFCVSDGATVADLTAEGDALVWYTDEALTTPAAEADALVEGTYYVTDTTEGGCESAATAVAVTFTDAATPTLTAGGNVFCEFDNPTIADLQANVSGGGTITWYDAATEGNVLNSSQLLQNGTTYYAASTDATSACESSVRLAVTVTLDDCPVIIPEAFSPNGDGVNDRFEIQHIADEFPNYTIEIFNRWGNTVFQGNASTPNWDGVSTESRSLGDKVLPVGVYFYIVNYNDGQTAPTQGRLYLSR